MVIGNIVAIGKAILLISMAVKKYFTKTNWFLPINFLAGY
jgi:hypothetical protein